MTDDDLERMSVLYRERFHEFELFKRAVVDYFMLLPELNRQPFPVLHSVKARLKDADHLRDKVLRKTEPENPITPDTLFSRVTDLCGVRVMHLHQKQIVAIHKAIQDKLDCRDWVLAEDPVAYSWDPESRLLYESLPVTVKIKESYYTSVHYLVRPRADSPVCCEVQVRTLFEEVWGEIDHAINYPYPTESLACREQLKVLARLVSTGTRLADAIFRTWEEHTSRTRDEPDVGPTPPPSQGPWG